MAKEEPTPASWLTFWKALALGLTTVGLGLVGYLFTAARSQLEVRIADVRGEHASIGQKLDTMLAEQSRRLPAIEEIDELKEQVAHLAEEVQRRSQLVYAVPQIQKDLGDLRALMDSRDAERRETLGRLSEQLLGLRQQLQHHDQQTEVLSSSATRRRR